MTQTTDLQALADGVLQFTQPLWPDILLVIERVPSRFPELEWRNWDGGEVEFGVRGEPGATLTVRADQRGGWRVSAYRAGVNYYARA